MDYRDPQGAFNQAIHAGHFTMDEDKEAFVGNYMYMGTIEGTDYFKNIMTREYYNKTYHK